jgi:hypothetical protein
MRVPDGFAPRPLTLALSYADAPAVSCPLQGLWVAASFTLEVVELDALAMTVPAIPGPHSEAAGLLSESPL